MQPGLVEQLGAPRQLGLDLAGDARFAERRQVDGDVGLAEHLVAGEAGQLPERARRPGATGPEGDGRCAG